jgi:putative transposase
MMKKQKYPTDLTDEQLEFIKEFLPVSNGQGRPPLSIHEVLNAIFYVVVGGIAWRMLPTDFPCWKSVYHYFRSWRRSGDWERIYNALHELERLRQGRGREPSAGCLDSQSVKNVGGEQAARGYDAGKKITGRKRHLLVDTIGLPIAVKVTAASESDQAGARQLFAESTDKIKNIKKVWVDGTYRGVEWYALVKEQYGIELEVKQNAPGVKGFVAVAKRWMVERTFGWLVQARRLVREYEKLAESTEAMIHLTMIRILVKRLAPDFSD